MAKRHDLLALPAATALAATILCSACGGAAAQVPVPGKTPIGKTALFYSVKDLGPSLRTMHQYGDINGFGSWFHWKLDDTGDAHLAGLHNQGNPPANQPYDLFNGLTVDANCDTLARLTIGDAVPGGLNSAGYSVATASYGNGNSRKIGLVLYGNVVHRVLCPVGNVESNSAQAHDINQNGFVVGTSNWPSRATEWAFYGDSVPQMIDLGGSGITNFGNQGSVATAINNQNGIVGYAYTGTSLSNAKQHAWLKRPDGSVKVNIAPPGDRPIAYDTNDSHIVVGSVQGPGPMRAWAYLPELGTPMVLPVIESPNGTFTQAFSINSSGTIVGECNLRPCQWKLAYRTVGTSSVPYYLAPTELKTQLFYGYTPKYQRALRINDAGAMLVEGTVDVAGIAETRMFIFRPPK